MKILRIMFILCFLNILQSVYPTECLDLMKDCEDIYRIRFDNYVKKDLLDVVLRISSVLVHFKGGRLLAVSPTAEKLYYKLEAAKGVNLPNGGKLSGRKISKDEIIDDLITMVQEHGAFSERFSGNSELAYEILKNLDLIEEAYKFLTVPQQEACDYLKAAHLKECNRCSDSLCFEQVNKKWADFLENQYSVFPFDVDDYPYATAQD